MDYSQVSRLLFERQRRAREDQHEVILITVKPDQLWASGSCRVGCRCADERHTCETRFKLSCLSYFTFLPLQEKELTRLITNQLCRYSYLHRYCMCAFLEHLALAETTRRPPKQKMRARGFGSSSICSVR